MLDCLVIGAGAAGLAAARTLHDAGLRVAVAEARDRLGGRTHTERDAAAGTVLELGGEFIHGENASTHALLRAAGMRAIAAERARNQRWLVPAGLRASDADRDRPLRRLADLPPHLKARWDAVAAAKRRLEGTFPPGPNPDVSLGEYLEREAPEAGFDNGLRRMADVLLAQTCCAPLEELSAADLARELATDQSGSREFRLEQGYSALWEWYARGLDARLNARVAAVHWAGSPEAVLADGTVLQAKTIVVTAPVPLLRDGGPIAFDPALPDRKREAIGAFRTEAATKLIYRFRSRFWDPDMTYLCQDALTARWWTPGEGRPDKPPYAISCYATARRAAELDRMPEEEALALGLAQLAGLLGRPLKELQAALVDARRVSWAADELALGGYAYVPTGAAWAREALAEPVEGKLFFAGEATAWHSNPQTVHGALDSGTRAAEEVLAVLRP